MQRRRRTAKQFQPGRVVATLVVFIWLTVLARADSFPTFLTLFTQVTNDIALIEENFLNTTEQKQALSTLNRVRTTILAPAAREEEVLSTAINLLNNDILYAASLDLSAMNARSGAVARYDALATRVAALPPSSRTESAQEFLDGLTPEKEALAIAEGPTAISQQLTPFARKLDTLDDLVERAKFMSRPRVGRNSVRVTIDRHRFKSGGNSAKSPNIFEVVSPADGYLEVNCRVVDRDEVIEFRLPVVTDQVRYEVGQGLATLTYNPAVFGTNDPLVATNGTFFVQAVEKEISGMFSCKGPGFEMKEGRFRIEIPRALRE